MQCDALAKKTHLKLDFFATGGAAAAPEPSEANITLLVDMGFPRQQAVEALREAHNDLSTATSILLRNS